MKQLLLGTTLVVFGVPAFAGDVAVSVSVGQPGFYGQIDIGNVPPPRVIYARPVVVEPVPEYRDVAPVYLHVPPGHEKHWSKHCREYDACGRPVYFVHHDWYNDEYVPRYRHGDHDEGEERGNRGHKGKHKDKDRGDRND